MYLTYDEYLDMGGKPDESAFARYSRKAMAEIDRHTLGRVKNMTTVPEAVKTLMFELIELSEDTDKARHGKAVASENVEGWSKSYAPVSVAEYEQTGLDLLLTCLSGVCDDNGVPLLYRGVG